MDGIYIWFHERIMGFLGSPRPLPKAELVHAVDTWLLSVTCSVFDLVIARASSQNVAWLPSGDVPSE